MSKPFAGIRILDFTRYLAGPYGTYQLGLLGADVIKIESREGDDTRGQLADRTWAERKMAPSFLAVNGNKRSLTLDLRKPEAIEIVKRLVAGADVVWENFRGGVMDRLGLGYEALSAINPRLIYCGVPRFVWSDFPLGNSAGRPFDRDSQAQTLELALRLLESAPAARTTVASPLRWPAEGWKQRYLDVGKLSPEDIEERRKEFDVVKAVAKVKREAV